MTFELESLSDILNAKYDWNIDKFINCGFKTNVVEWSDTSYVQILQNMPLTYLNIQSTISLSIQFTITDVKQRNLLQVVP